MPTGTTSMYQAAPGYGAVQAASYYPGYSYGPGSGYGPMVAPVFNPMAVPAYWNSDR